MLFKKRNTNCGELRIENINKDVILNGWVQTVRDMGGLIFIDLRDRWGITQLVIEPENFPELAQKAKEVKSEFVLWAEGKVRERESPNKNIPTGLIEVLLNKFEIINKSELPPFEVINDLDTNEETRLKYRFLDLRRPALQRNFEVRNRLYQVMHQYYAKHNFYEVETPILMKSTPEGARDFLVPSRINKGKFYALPQSPQLYKQILMVSGFERYVQIAKCFRDEDLRSDRQPEFTQIDVEMSFIEADDIIALTEGYFKELWKEVLGMEIQTPFLRMTYEEAMMRFGSDKPDLRFGLELTDITKHLQLSGFKVFSDAIENKGIISCLNAKGCGSYSRKNIDDLTELAKKYGAKGLAWIKLADGAVNSPIAKFLTEEELANILKETKAEDGDLLLIVSDKKYKALTVLGALRLEVAKREKILEKVKNEFSFSWVVDFPLVEFDEKENRFVALHHPFTAPLEEDLHLIYTNPEAVRANAYDVVINGAEVGGGSIRIHRSDVQEQMFKLLGLSKEEQASKFGYFLDALKFGAPPHGGIALGVDRVTMTLCGTDNIRDVIAFPKTTSGLSLMDGCPSPVDIKQLEELGVQLLKELKQ